MKITRQQLVKLIESYQGLIGGPEAEDDEKEVFVFDTPDQNTLGQSTTGEPIADISSSTSQKIGKNVKAPGEKQKSAIGRSVKGKRFSLKADRIFGAKTFPGTNVYLIPIAGSEKEVSGLAFNYEPEDSRRDYSFTKSTNKRPGTESYWSDPKPKKLSDVEMNIFQNRRIDFDSARHQIYDLSAEGINILSNLGVLVSEIEKLNLEKDIVFVPSLTGTSKNFAGLPRMILHALFDSTGDDPNPNSFIDDILRPLYDKTNNHLSVLGLTPSLDAGIDSTDKAVSKMALLVSKIGTTAAFRNAKIFTSRDMISEFLVQEITDSSPPAGSTFLWGKDNQSKKLEILPKGQKGMTFNKFYFGFLPNGRNQVVDRFNSGTELSSNKEGFVENRPNSQSFFLELREDIKKAAAQIRERIKGKIILINVV